MSYVGWDAHHIGHSSPDTPGICIDIPASLVHQLSMEIWPQIIRPDCAPCVKELHNLILRGMDHTPSQSIGSYASLSFSGYSNSMAIDGTGGESDEGDEATHNIQEGHVGVSHAFFWQLK
jgi:hypothetical protein